MTDLTPTELSRRAASARWRKINKEQSKQIKQRYKDTHPEACRAHLLKSSKKRYAKLTPEDKQRREQRRAIRVKEMFQLGGDQAKQYIADRLIRASRHRAKQCGITHTLKKGDITIPENCPVLGTPLYIQQSTNEEMTPEKIDNSPQIDRIIPSMGYIPGNVIVVSAKANRIKSNANWIEIMKVAEFYKQLHEEAL
jgi:hypothetical protein